MSGPVLDPSTWADLLVDRSESALVEALQEAESYRTCLLQALGLWHAEQLAHARTKARYAVLLDEVRAARRGSARAA